MTIPTLAQLAVKLDEEARARAVAIRGLAATDTVLRDEVARDYTDLAHQTGLVLAKLQSILCHQVLTTTRAGQPILIHNPAPIAIPVAILCTTTNVGPRLLVPASGMAAFTDDTAGDIVELVSVYDFTASLG